MNSIHQAAARGDQDALARLLEEGGDVDLRDAGKTSLLVACESPDAGPDVIKLLLNYGADVGATCGGYGGEDLPLIALAVKSTASCEKLRLLFERGADFKYRSSKGYSLMTWAACADRMDVIDLLLSLGAPMDGNSDHNESVLSVLSRMGRFGQIGKVLEHGADTAPLKWTALHRAIALGTLRDVESLLEAGANPEVVENWERTALLLAIHSGDTEKAALLLAWKANRNATGRCAKPPTHYPLESDNVRMMRWLIEQGFDLNQEDEFGHTPLMEAAEKSAVACFRLLVESGAVWIFNDEDIISSASHPEIVGMLYERGDDLCRLHPAVLRNFIYLGSAPDLPVSREEFLQCRTRKFGPSNPERMDIPFWMAMVRNGWSGYEAARQFDEDGAEEVDPVWSQQRFGMSLTPLQDGRFIQIAGEHEDHYDPDFCIYNDVFVHDGMGGFAIFGYPENVFPPTDFHSATLVLPWIYIIGNLGYPADRTDDTPVFRLHVNTLRVERVAVRGTSPGWIHGHRAEYVAGGIRLTGGNLLTNVTGGSGQIIARIATHFLDLDALSWRCECDD